MKAQKELKRIHGWSCFGFFVVVVVGKAVCQLFLMLYFFFSLLLVEFLFICN